MHSHHYNSEQTSGPKEWAFHCNGDPLPGPVVINKRGKDWDQKSFRTTAEDLVAFVVARKLGAISENAIPCLCLQTTTFAIIGPDVTLTVSPSCPADFREKYDETAMTVPFDCIEGFIMDTIYEKFESALNEERVLDNDRVMAAIGMVSFLLRNTDNS